MYRRQGESFAQACIQEAVEYGVGSRMFWGSMTTLATTSLMYVSRTGSARGEGSPTTAARYITEILEEQVVPYASFVGSRITLMHDEARCHTALIVRDYLQDVGIPVMRWPVLSPALNPIE